MAQVDILPKSGLTVPVQTDDDSTIQSIRFLSLTVKSTIGQKATNPSSTQVYTFLTMITQSCCYLVVAREDRT
jgi:hypothetical protein